MDRRDPELIKALARGASAPKAARASGYSPRTVARRKDDPEFMKKVERCREQMLRNATGALAHATAEAVVCLRHLLTDDSSTVRLGAARAILESAFKFAETEELRRQIAELEIRISTHESGKTDPNSP